MEWPTLPRLPPFIPVVDTPASNDRSVLRLRQALGPRAWRHGHHAGACLIGSDRKHGRLMRRLGDLGPHLRQMNAAFAIAPAFSTWWTESPYSAADAMVRTAYVASELSRHAPTIPSIVWRTTRDMQHWAEWIDVTRPPGLAVDLGTARADRDWATLASDLATLRANCGGYVPRLVVSGPSTVARIAGISNVWPDLTIISAFPDRVASAGSLLLDDLTSLPAPGLSRQELRVTNRTAMLQTVQSQLDALEATDVGSAA